MPPFGLVGPSYALDSKNADCQITKNWYVEQIESGFAATGAVSGAKGKSGFRLARTPGLKVFATPTSATKHALASAEVSDGGNKYFSIKSLQVTGGDPGTVQKNRLNWATTGANSNAGVAWTAPASVVQTQKTSVPDPSDNHVTLTSGQMSQYLDLTGFNFTIPSGSVINGVMVELSRCMNSGANVADSVVMLIKGGGYGDNKANLAKEYIFGTLHSTNQPTWSLTSNYIQAQYGASNDAWNTGFSAADINDASFGVRVQIQNQYLGAISDTAYLASASITVYYTPPLPDRLVVETSLDNDFVVGDEVLFANVSHRSELNGWKADITEIVDTKHFAITNTTHPWTDNFDSLPVFDTGSVSDVVPNYVRLTTQTDHGLSVGTAVTVVNITTSGVDWLNGVSAVISEVPATTQIKFPTTHAIMALTNCDGDVALGNVSDYAKVRANIEVNGRAFYVIATFLYEVKADGSYIQRGTLIDDQKPASMAASSLELCISAGGQLYSYDLTSNILAAVSDGSGLISNIAQVAYCDGYFVALVKDAFPAEFRISALNDVTSWDAADKAQISVFPDSSVSMVFDHRELVFFCSTKSVVYYNSGDVNFPFAPVQGSYIDQGTVAPFASVRLDNSTFWIGRDDRGMGIGYRLQGYSPSRVTNHSIEAEWQSYGDISDAVGYGFQLNGHSFWHVYFPTANKAWRYDVATGMWHEVGFWNGHSYDAHRSQSHIFCFGKHLVGDWATGNIYDMSLNYWDDFGNPTRRVRRAAHVTREGGYIFFNRLDIEGEFGGVTITDADGTQRAPQIMLRWSDDDAHRWSNEHWKDAGEIGDYGLRVYWTRMGRCWGPRGRVYELVVSDPAPWSITEAYLS